MLAGEIEWAPQFRGSALLNFLRFKVHFVKKKSSLRLEKRFKKWVHLLHKKVSEKKVHFVQKKNSRAAPKKSSLRSTKKFTKKLTSFRFFFQKISSLRLEEKVHFVQKKFHEKSSFRSEKIHVQSKKSSPRSEKSSKKKVHFVQKKSSLRSEKSSGNKVHFVSEKKFIWYRKKGSCALQKRQFTSFRKKCSVHVPSEGSHTMREKVHLALAWKFRKFLFSLNRNRFLFSWDNIYIYIYDFYSQGVE